MSEQFSIERVRDYWTNQALEHGGSPAASWSDIWAIDLEVREIIKRLEDGDRLLDIGCANGYSSIQLAAHKRVSILAMDYIPEMIQEARRRLLEFKQGLCGSIVFEVGDILNLPQFTELFDKIVVIRVIINLSTWERQRQALRNCVKALKPGGKLLLSEATLQGWKRLNALREEWGLAAIPMPPFNQYVDEELVVNELRDEMDLVEIANFASSYFVGTRVIKPLLINALAANMDPADPTMEWNRWFSSIPAAGDYGTQKIFVFQKNNH
jgi:ubiquinone/menaquinone biosynthesis C-methylase UbiE